MVLLRSSTFLDLLQGVGTANAGLGSASGEVDPDEWPELGLELPLLPPLLPELTELGTPEPEDRRHLA